MKNKRLNIVYFLPIVIFILAVNIIIDPASLTSFTPQEEIWAKEMLNGNIVFLKKPDFNERKIKQKLIEQMTKEPEVLALGPSLIKSVRRKDAGVENFYNLGVYSSNIYDLLAMTGLLEINGVKPKKMILCVDSLLFDEKIYNTSQLHKQLFPYTKYMIDILNNNPKASAPNKRDEFFAFALQYTGNLFSLTYYQASLKYALKNKSFEIYSVEKEPEDYDISKIDGPSFMSDGSYVFPLSKRNKSITAEDIRFMNTIHHNPTLALGAHMSEFGKDMFEKLIKYYTNKGVKIELFLCPFPPRYWDILIVQDYPLLKEQEDFAKELADKYNLSITGSLNPYNVGIKDEDYFDVRHIRHERMNKYFDFTK